MKKYQIEGIVELFPQKGGWYYTRVPKKITSELSKYADRGLIPINAVINEYTWKTSLLPMGDGTHFIALNSKVRKKENITIGDKIKIKFELR